jgi:hypothetical protein
MIGQLGTLEDRAMNESKEVLAHLIHALGSSTSASRHLQFDQFSGTNDALYATCSLMFLSLRPAGPYERFRAVARPVRDVLW